MGKEDQQPHRGYSAFWCRQDCTWQVIAPLGVIVERWPHREQAVAAVARLNAAAARLNAAAGSMGRTEEPRAAERPERSE